MAVNSKLHENKGPFLTTIQIHGYIEMNFSTPQTKIPSELQSFCPVKLFTDITKAAISVLLVPDSQNT